jgi:hypothetical protein
LSGHRAPRGFDAHLVEPVDMARLLQLLDACSRPRAS